MTEKSQNSFEDCVVRVPLLIKPPVWEKTDPGISDAMTELVDFYATVMDYADIKPQRTQFGISLPVQSWHHLYQDLFFPIQVVL